MHHPFCCRCAHRESAGKDLANIELGVGVGFGKHRSRWPISYLFDRFFNADKAQEATAGKMGLGLAICKALVTAQGDIICAESDGKEKGGRMRISLPPAPA